MAECILLKGGSGFNQSGFTATPDKVREGKKFMGAGSDKTQTGTLKDVPATIFDLPLNGRVDIPAGIHSGNVVIRQKDISVKDGGTVYPRDYDQTISVKNSYVKDDVYIAPLTGLEPRNIKKGVTIKLKDRTVVGTYEGYN